MSGEVPNLNNSELWQGVCRLTALTAFEVTDSGLHKECAQHIVAAIRLLTQLEWLVIRPPASTAEGVTFERRQHINHLLHNCFGPDMALALQQLSRLTYLDMHGTIWKSTIDADPHPLDLSHLQHLRHLDLSDLSCGFVAPFLACVNLSACSSLQHLDLSQRCPDITSLTESMPALSALTHLSLCFVPRTGAAGVASVLSCCAHHCAKLCTLQLELDCCEADQSTLTSMTALTCLQIEAHMCAAWCSTLTAFVSLERLNIVDAWSPDVDSLGVAVQSMSQMPQLKSLTFNGVPAEVNYRAHERELFLAAFEQLTQITYLQLASDERLDDVRWDGPFTAFVSVERLNIVDA